MAKIVWTGAALDGDWANTANWLSGTTPAAADDVYFTGTNNGVTLSLDQHTLVLASLNFDASFTGVIGNANEPLWIECPLYNIGMPAAFGNSNGAGRIYIKNNAAAVANIFSTSQASADVGINQPSVRLFGSSLTINCQAGTNGLGLATSAGETVTVTALKITSGSNAQIFAGEGATITALDMQSGNVVSESAATCPAANIFGGSYTNIGDGAHTAIVITPGGKCFYNGTGTITDVDTGGLLDLSGDAHAKTITNAIIARTGASINLDNGAGNITNGGVTLKQCDLSGLASIKIGGNSVTFARAA